MESSVTTPTRPLNWRQCSSPEDLWSLASWPDDGYKGLFVETYRMMQHRLKKENPEFSFSDCLAKEVKGFLRRTRDKVRQDRAGQEIDWQQFDMYLESGDDRFDTLVEQVYLELRRLAFEDEDNIVDVINCLKSLFGMGSLLAESGVKLRTRLVKPNPKVYTMRLWDSNASTHRRNMWLPIHQLWAPAELARATVSNS